MHSRQRGFSLAEMMIVVVIIGGLTLFAVPKFAVLRERSQLTSARQEIEAAIATARASAIQKGRTARVHMNGNNLWVTVIPIAGGAETTVLPRLPLDTLYSVKLTPSDTVIVFGPRGFASPRLSGTPKFVLQGPTRRDSVCVTTLGQIMSRGCTQ